MCYMWWAPHYHPKSEGLCFRVSTSRCAGQGPEAVERVRGLVKRVWQALILTGQSLSSPTATWRAEGPQLLSLHLRLLMSPAFLWKKPQHLLLCLLLPLGGWSLASAALSQTSWGPWVPKRMKQAAAPSLHQSESQSGSHPLLSRGLSHPQPTCCAFHHLLEPTSRMSTATRWAVPCSGSGGLRLHLMPWTRPSASCKPASGGNSGYGCG